MIDKPIRDRLNNIKGWIKTLPNGTQEILNHHSKYLGTYNPMTDETRNRKNELIGKGNLLLILLATDFWLPV